MRDTFAFHHLLTTEASAPGTTALEVTIIHGPTHELQMPPPEHEKEEEWAVGTPAAPTNFPGEAATEDRDRISPAAPSLSLVSPIALAKSPASSSAPSHANAIIAKPRPPPGFKLRPPVMRVLDASDTPPASRKRAVEEEGTRRTTRKTEEQDHEDIIEQRLQSRPSSTYPFSTSGAASPPAGQEAPAGSSASDAEAEEEEEVGYAWRI